MKSNAPPNTSLSYRIWRKLSLSLKLTSMLAHLISGIVMAVLFVPKGIHHNKRATQLFLWWNRRMCKIFNTQLTTQGEINTQTTLFVMNHISWFDIPVLASQQPLHFLSKAEVRHWPLIGWLSNRVGTLFIKRGATGAAQNSLEDIVRNLKQGHSVVIFPEGTTTDGKTVRKFHGRLLQAAIDAGVMIQPITLRYPYKQGVNPYVPYIDDMSFMDSMAGLNQLTSLKVELHFLPPIDAHLNATEETSRKQLAQISEQAIKEKLLCLENTPTPKN